MNYPRATENGRTLSRFIKKLRSGSAISVQMTLWGPGQRNGSTCCSNAQTPCPPANWSDTICKTLRGSKQSVSRVTYKPELRGWYRKNSWDTLYILLGLQVGEILTRRSKLDRDWTIHNTCLFWMTLFNLLSCRSLKVKVEVIANVKFVCSVKNPIKFLHILIQTQQI